MLIRCLLLVREVWGSNPEPIKPLTRCQWLATAAILMCGFWRKLRSWTLLTRDIRKGIKRVQRRLDFNDKLNTSRLIYIVQDESVTDTAKNCSHTVLSFVVSFYAEDLYASVEWAYCKHYCTVIFRVSMSLFN